MHTPHRASGAAWLIILALLAALANVLATGEVRQLLSLPILVVPGWAVGRVIFPAGTLKLHERLAVAGCLTIAVLVVLGFGLNLLPGGLDQASWEWSLIAVTLGAAAAELWLAHARSDSAPRRSQHKLPIGTLVGSAGALVLLGGGLALAHQSALTHDKATRFTQLWMLPGAQRGKVAYGVRNEEGRVQRYVLKATLRSGRLTLLRTGPFSLAPGSSRTGSLRVPVGQRRRTVILKLFKVGSASAYRSTRLTVR